MTRRRIRDEGHGHCGTTHKVCLGWAMANRIAGRMRRRDRHAVPVRPYHCSDCGWWHIGHPPTMAPHGADPRREAHQGAPRPVSPDPWVHPPRG